jgi:hypothetical protein
LVNAPGKFKNDVIASLSKKLQMEVENKVAKHPMYESYGPILATNPSDAFATLRSTIPITANPFTSQLSYGRKAIPNLVRDLGDAKLPPQQRALVCLTELFHSPEHVSQGISEKIVPLLINYLTSQNITCRQKASESLMIISNHVIGRNSILERKKNILSIAVSFDDTDDLVRKHISETISNVTTSKKGVDYFLDGQLFKVLIAKLHRERLDIQIPLLRTCYNCIRLDTRGNMPQMAIESDSLMAFTDIADRSLILDVKVLACECVMMLCIHHECKKLATNPKIITILLALLSHSKPAVRAAASGAIMRLFELISISIDCDAKRSLVRENAVKILSLLLSDENELVQLNAIKVI